MDSPYSRLAAADLELPEAPAPAAAYVPYMWHDQTLYTAGQIPFVDGKLETTGQVGADVDAARATELAATCALNVLAVADAATDGQLDTVRLVKLTVFVAVADTFTAVHEIANGASKLCITVLGEHGIHARSAVGVRTLPLNAPVEVEAVFARL